jgi:crotonobetaine/carnitine-CoA ligase
MTPSLPNACVTRDLLERNAAQWPELVVLKFATGEQYTCAELLAAVRQQAAGLQALGVQQDEYVLSWLPNGPLAVLTWLALNYLGAVYVPINTAYKGRLLKHVIQNSGARLMIADGRLLQALTDIDTAGLTQVVVAGPERPLLPRLELLPASVLTGHAGQLQDPQRSLQDWDTQCVIFTSGTTGPSKGVLCSYRHTYTAALEFRHVGPGDCNLVALPMFHIGGLLGINFALIHGGTAAIVERFRTDHFWDTVSTLGVTTVGLLGTMVQFLMQQPPRPGEREHTLRSAVIAPFGADAVAFGKRFGIPVYTEFNMTELSVPLYCGPDPTVPGTCGKPRAGVQLKLVDAHDQEVAQGSIGELILRTDEPWTLSHGYLNDPVATAHTWRNGWFHTGDLFYHDSEHNYFFVDRVKDMMRRRGENISSFEVEAELLACPGVKAAAAVAVPGDGGEDEVLAVLAPAGDATLDPAQVIAFLQPRMANFMIPRYIRIVTELPLTPSQKIEKHVLRAEGLTADTWDRAAAGIKLQRQDLSQRAPLGHAGDSRAPALHHTDERGDPAPRHAGENRGRSLHHTRESGNSLRRRPGESRSPVPPATSQTPLDSSLRRPDEHGPLHGLKILEFAGLGPAPFCCMLLSDMGAEVIRIDRPGTTYEPADIEARGRNSLQLDLKSADGKAQALALITDADILIEGFRPGVMERLGLGPDSALASNPKLIYGRMTGWGQTGPQAHKAGHDLNYLALTGALHALGTKDKPAVPLNLIADFGGGALYLAMGVLAALHHVRQGGAGQVVDCAMTDGVISMLAMIYGDLATGAWIDERESNVIDGAAPFYNVYRCADGKWLSLAAIEPQFYARFLDVTELRDADFQQQWNRQLWPVMKTRLEAFFLTRARDAWSAFFAAHDVCVAPVLSLREAQQHPHNIARNSFITKEGISQPAPAPRFSVTKARGEEES